MAFPAQLGCCNVTPLWQHWVQRREARIMSDEASIPQRIIKGAIAIGTLCRQRQSAQ
jgi:hypothetical protein